MKKRSDYIFFCVVSIYISLSLLAGALILLAGLAAVQAGIVLARLALGSQQVSMLKPIFSDAAGFALICAMTALAQYYLTSLLALCGAGRLAMSATAGCSALFLGLFFWRAAELSNLGAYGLSGLPVTLAALIGGAAAITQKAEENPWPRDCSRLFDWSDRF